MLSYFRKGGIAQVFAGIIVGAIIVVFVIQFQGAGAPTGSLNQECAIKIYDDCVGPKDFFAAYGLIVPRGIQPKAIRSLKLREKVLHGLLERELLLREARRVGIGVGDEEVDETLMLGRAHVSVPVQDSAYLGYTLGLGNEMVRLLPVRDFKTKKFDYRVYQRVIRNTAGRSPKEFKEMQKDELIAARMRELVRSRVRVSAQEAKMAFERDRSKAVVRVVSIPRGWFERYVTTTTDEVVDAWADSHTAEIDGAWKVAEKSWTADCALASEIFVTVAAQADDDTKVILRNKIDQAAKLVSGGEAFAKVAREMSEGPTAAMGGELGCLNDGYGEGYKTLLESIDGLEPGGVSPVLETKRGFHLIKFAGKLAKDEVEKVGRRTIARRLAVRSAADAATKEFASKLLAEAKSGANLEEATKALARTFALRAYAKEPDDDETLPALVDPNHPRMQVSAPFARGEGRPVPGELPTGTPASTLAFQLDKDGDMHPDPIMTFDGVALMQLKEKTIASDEDFEKDKGEVMRLLLGQKQNDALVRYVASLRKAADSRTEIDQQFAEDPKGDDGSPAGG